MNVSKNEPLRIDYPKHWFVIMTIVFEAVAAWLFYTAYTNAPGLWRDAWIIISPVIGIFAALFLVPPMFTHHLAGAKGIRIRMGWLINITIPYAWIMEVKETSVPRGGLRVGVGVRYFPISKALFVTSSFSSLVKLKLDGEHELGGILRKRHVEEIVLSVSYTPALIEAVRARAGLAKGV